MLLDTSGLLCLYHKSERSIGYSPFPIVVSNPRQA